MRGFTVSYRNPGHWDIYTFDSKRLFKIRGGPGTFEVIDEQKTENNSIIFKTISSAMSYVCDELMFDADTTLNRILKKKINDYKSL